MPEPLIPTCLSTMQDTVLHVTLGSQCACGTVTPVTDVSLDKSCVRRVSKVWHPYLAVRSTRQQHKSKKGWGEVGRNISMFLWQTRHWGVEYPKTFKFERNAHLLEHVSLHHGNYAPMESLISGSFIWAVPQCVHGPDAEERWAQNKKIVFCFIL